MINQDFYSLSEFRNDGRKRDELRDITIKMGFDNEADGSAMYQIGLTQVECRVQGPLGV